MATIKVKADERKLTSTRFAFFAASVAGKIAELNQLIEALPLEDQGDVDEDFDLDVAEILNAISLNCREAALFCGEYASELNHRPKNVPNPALTTGGVTEE